MCNITTQADVQQLKADGTPKKTQPGCGPGCSTPSDLCSPKQVKPQRFSVRLQRNTLQSAENLNVVVQGPKRQPQFTLAPLITELQSLISSTSPPTLTHAGTVGPRLLVVWWSPLEVFLDSLEGLLSWPHHGPCQTPMLGHHKWELPGAPRDRVSLAEGREVSAASLVTDAANPASTCLKQVVLTPSWTCKPVQLAVILRPQYNPCGSQQ